MILTVNRDYFFNSINKLIFLKVRFGILFEVRNESLNITYKNLFLKCLRRFLLRINKYETNEQIYVISNFILSALNLILSV
jgi:hypothetical protein